MTITVGSDVRGPAPFVVGARPQELRIASGFSCQRLGVLWSRTVSSGEQERALIVKRGVFGDRGSPRSERNSRLRCGVRLTIGWSGRDG
jgi:hypothetical protein